MCHQALFLVPINSRISDIPPGPLQCRVYNQPCGTFQALSKCSNRQVGVQSQIDRSGQASTLLLKNAQAMNLPAPNKRPETESVHAHATTPRVDQFTNSEGHECTKPQVELTSSRIQKFTNPRIHGCSRIRTGFHGCSRIHEFTNPRTHEPTDVSRIQGCSRMHVCSARSLIRNGLLRVVFRARYVPRKNDTHPLLLHIVFRARYVPKKMIRANSRILKIDLRTIFRILEIVRIIFFWYVSRTKHDM